MPVQRKNFCCLPVPLVCGWDGATADVKSTHSITGHLLFYRALLVITRWKTARSIQVSTSLFPIPFDNRQCAWIYLIFKLHVESRFIFFSPSETGRRTWLYTKYRTSYTRHAVLSSHKGHRHQPILFPISCCLMRKCWRHQRSRYRAAARRSSPATFFLPSKEKTKIVGFHWARHTN